MNQFSGLPIFQLNRDHIRAQANQAREREQAFAEFANLNFYQWKPGENILRLLPPYSQRGLIFKEVGRHYNIPPLTNDAKGESNPICATLTFSEVPGIRCPFCDVMEAISQQYSQVSLSEYKARRRGYAWAIDRREMDKGPQIINFPGMTMDQVIVFLDSPDWDIINIESGVDLHITKTGQRINTKYMVIPAPRRTPLAPDRNNMAVNDMRVLAYWLGLMKDLDLVFKMPEGADLDVYAARAKKLMDMLAMKADSAIFAQQNQSLGFMGSGYMQPPAAPVMSTGYPMAPISSGSPSYPMRPPVMAGVSGPGIQPPMVPSPLPQSVTPPAFGVAPPQVPTQVPTAIPPGNMVMPPAGPAAVPPQIPGASSLNTATPTMFPVNPNPPLPPVQTATTPIQAVPPQNPAIIPTAWTPPIQLPAIAVPGIIPMQPVQPQQPVPPGAGGQVQPMAGVVPPPTNVKPQCFGGAVSHPDGSKGYNPNMGACMKCMDEMACTDATNAAQKG